MIPLLITIYFLSQIDLSNTFRIVSYTQNEQSFVPGQTLSLTCKSDSSWEFCLWKHTNSDYKEVGVRDCLMEWKRAKGGVSVEKCHAELTNRVSISGDYDNQECGLTITGLEVEDGGSWECEMEEYKFGDWLSGNKHSHSFNVNVNLRTTTTISTTTTTLTTTVTTTSTTTTFMHTTTSASTTTEIVTEEETTALPITTNHPENSSLHEDDDDSEEVMETNYEYEESNENHGHQEDQETIDSNKPEGRSDIPIYDEDVEALAIEDEASAEGSVGVIVGIVVLVLGLAIGTAVGGIFWNRKRKSIDVVSLHKIRDNSGASNSFLEDSEYHVSIVGEPEE
eukprot:GFUD01132781.1.p1 GENE.GFUD01132781.1~~GFUD01132781.1.p1  ORF type:complete len:338 (+),score=97.91 GFUD01132781.1:37-1050(+)